MGPCQGQHVLLQIWGSPDSGTEQASGSPGTCVYARAHVHARWTADRETGQHGQDRQVETRESGWQRGPNTAVLRPPGAPQVDTDISAATPLSCSLAGEPGQLPSFPGGCPGHYLQGHRSRAPAPEGVLILLTWRGADSRAWWGAGVCPQGLRTKPAARDSSPLRHLGPVSRVR